MNYVREASKLIIFFTVYSTIWLYEDFQLFLTHVIPHGNLNVALLGCPCGSPCFLSLYNQRSNKYNNKDTEIPTSMLSVNIQNKKKCCMLASQKEYTGEHNFCPKALKANSCYTYTAHSRTYSEQQLHACGGVRWWSEASSLFMLRC